MRERHWLAVAGLAAMTVLALTGCVPSAIPAFDREATAEDALPPGADELWVDENFADLDADAIRHAATWKTAELFYIQREEGDLCLLVWDGQESVMSCGAGGMLGVSGPHYSFEMRPAPIGELEGWTVISENIRVEN